MQKTMKYIFLIYLITAFSVFAVDKGNQGTLQKPTLDGDVYNLRVNNIDLAMENNGVLGLDGTTYYPTGTELSFLYSGGFAASGYVAGDLRASWQATASRIKEYQPGKWGMDYLDPTAKFYVVTKDDKQGSDAYNEWATAVTLGASFVDLDGDNVYDPNVDMPDIIGDETVWCVYSDGVPQANRALLSLPLGLEIQQTAFAFNRGDALGDVVFIRYRINNATTDNIDSLIFSGWVDPDLGADYSDDLIGCDTDLSVGYIYNFQDDPGGYGPNPPCFGIDFFQGPVVDSPGDTAFSVKGPFLGVDTLLDKKNLPLTSFSYYIQSDPTIGDPDVASEARNYQVGGLDQDGDAIIASAWGSGGIDGVSDVKYFYNGDPVTATGWRDTNPADKRFMVNCGPFQLPAGETQDVVVAYIVGRGADALNSITVMKETDALAQAVYFANFTVAGPPPVPPVTIREIDNVIDLVFDVRGTVGHVETDILGSRQVFEGLKVYQFSSESTEDFESGLVNARLIGQYDLDDMYGSIYLDTDNGRELIWSQPQATSLDSALMADSEMGYLHMQITGDAFNSDNPLINNKEYYFSVVPFSINRNGLVPNDVTGDDPNDYVAPTPADFLETSRGAGFFTAIPGSDENLTYIVSQNANRVAGTSDGSVYVEVVDKDAVTGHDYEVGFINVGTMWRLTDLTTTTVLLDSMDYYETGEHTFNFPVVDGLMFRIFGPPTDFNVETSILPTGNSWDSHRPYLGVSYYTPTFVNNLEIRFVAGPADTSLAPVFQGDADGDTMFYGRAYLDGNGDPIWAFDSGGDPYTDPNDYRMYSVPFEFWDTGLDDDTADDVRIFPLQYGAHASVDLTDLTLYLNASDYAGNVYDQANPESFFTDHPFRSDPAQVGNYWVYDPGVHPSRLDWAYRFSFGSNTYEKGETAFIYPNKINTDTDRFTFSTSAFFAGPTTAERKSLLDRVLPVPNPYFAYSGHYENSYDVPVIKFTHMDQTATVRIFNLAGRLVRTLEKNDNSSSMTWDLRNEAGLKVASGMYIAHVKVPGVGEKILKLAIIQREERIDRY